jgi:hypothetical protein
VEKQLLEEWQAVGGGEAQIPDLLAAAMVHVACTHEATRRCSLENALGDRSREDERLELGQAFRHQVSPIRGNGRRLWRSNSWRSGKPSVAAKPKSRGPNLPRLLDIQLVDKGKILRYTPRAGSNFDVNHGVAGNAVLATGEEEGPEDVRQPA